MNFAETPPDDPRFYIGARVANDQDSAEPKLCGRIIQVTHRGPGGRQFKVAWDNGTTGLLAERAMVPCPAH